MSESTDMVVSLPTQIKNIGVVTDNSWNIEYAISKCHEALCPLDQEQLNRIGEEFPSLITVANMYAHHTPGKRAFKANGS